jgi:hypothetical protein
LPMISMISDANLILDARMNVFCHGLPLLPRFPSVVRAWKVSVSPAAIYMAKHGCTYNVQYTYCARSRSRLDDTNGYVPSGPFARPRSVCRLSSVVTQYRRAASTATSGHAPPGST